MYIFQLNSILEIKFYARNLENFGNSRHFCKNFLKYSISHCKFNNLIGLKGININTIGVREQILEKYVVKAYDSDGHELLTSSLLLRHRYFVGAKRNFSLPLNIGGPHALQP